MANKFSISELEKLKKQGNIRDFEEVKKGCNEKKSKYGKGNKIKGWIDLNLNYWCMANNLELIREYKFHPVRKWRFDWFIKELSVGIEYEGLMSSKSRHTTVKGFTGDTEKYNEAQRLGFQVFRYTALNYKNIINDLDKIKES